MRRRILKKKFQLVYQKSTNFIIRLLNHQALIKDIMDCALRPDKLDIP